MSIIKDAPEEIYLVIEGVEPGDTFKDCHDVTWEAEQINDNDVKYIRADKIEALEADAARYRFLRNNPLKGAEETMPYIHSAENDMRFWALTLEDADATIDAAMQVKP